jgi:hypothetical protein
MNLLYRDPNVMKNLQAGFKGNDAPVLMDDVDVSLLDRSEVKIEGIIESHDDDPEHIVVSEFGRYLRQATEQAFERRSGRLRACPRIFISSSLKFSTGIPYGKAPGL